MRQIIPFGEALIDFLSDGGNPERFTQFAGGAPANQDAFVALPTRADVDALLARFPA